MSADPEFRIIYRYDYQKQMVKCIREYAELTFTGVRGGNEQIIDLIWKLNRKFHYKDEDIFYQFAQIWFRTDLMMIEAVAYINTEKLEDVPEFKIRYAGHSITI